MDVCQPKANNKLVKQNTALAERAKSPAPGGGGGKGKDKGGKGKGKGKDGKGRIHVDFCMKFIKGKECDGKCGFPHLTQEEVNEVRRKAREEPEK